MTSGFTKPSKPNADPWFWLPRLSIMDRYIASELLLPFLFGVGAFSSIGVSIGAVFDLISRIAKYGLPLSLALEIVLLKLPEFVAYAFPVAALLATLTTYSRLSNDSELVALRNCGISVYRLVMPAIVLCCVVTGLTFAFNELIVPAANYRATNKLEQALNEDRPTFQEKNIVYQQYEEREDRNGKSDKTLSRIFYARRFNGKEMQGLTILDFSKEGLDQIIVAQSALWDFQKSLWNFYDGTIYGVSSDGGFRNIATFEEQQLQISRKPLDLASRRRDYNEMNIAQALEYRELLAQSGDDDKLLELQVRIQQKIALPFICIAYGIVGAALGATLRRTGRATGFALSLMIVFGYYLMAVTTGAIAQLGFIPPILGAWLPNLFGLTAGGFLLYRAAR
ncbi:MAG TPA: LptF/LptG family permease [Chroococcidiopsis sp.]